jgi:1,4-alpha-glucan branching enzyme
MIYKMPGDEWQKFANLRLLYTYMFTHPGAKLLFMGNEFGQTDEWNYKTALRWDLLAFDCHKGLQACVRDLAKLLKSYKSLYINQFDHKGFEWKDLDHRAESIISYLRKGDGKEDDLLILLNMTPVERIDWIVQMNEGDDWLEIFNSDDKRYWGTGNYVNNLPISPSRRKNNDLYEIKLSLPPLGGCVLKRIIES